MMVMMMMMMMMMMIMMFLRSNSIFEISLYTSAVYGRKIVQNKLNKRRKLRESNLYVNPWVRSFKQNISITMPACLSVQYCVK